MMLIPRGTPDFYLRGSRVDCESVNGRSPSLSGLTPIVSNKELTHLGSEASNCSINTDCAKQHFLFPLINLSIFMSESFSDFLLIGGLRA